MNQSEETIVSTIHTEYGIKISSILPLNLGEDYDARTFKVLSIAGESYFLKIRESQADAVVLEIPNYLHTHGVPEVLSPLAARSGALSVGLRGQQLILYPFIASVTAATTGLSPGQWTQLGRAVSAWHNLALPDHLARLVQRETFSPDHRILAADYLRRALSGKFDLGVGEPLSALLRAQRDEITHALERAGALAQSLAAEPHSFVLCHGDLTPWNILVQPEGSLTIVDWDSPRLAPPECDLMFVGGNLTGKVEAQAAQADFYRGYGRIVINPAALAYYRYERVIMDLAAFCQEMWQQSSPGIERVATITGYVAGNFQPDGTLAAARKADALI